MMDVVIILGFGFIVVLFVMLGNQVQRQTASVLQLEVMVQALLDNAEIDFDPDEAIKQKVVEALARDNKIQAIRQHREFTGSSLKDAKDFVEKLQHETGSEA